MTRKDWWSLLLYVTIAVAAGFTDLRMRPHTDKVVTEYIPGVVANTEFAPGKYRVLAPFVINETAAITGVSLQAAWYGTRLLFLFLAFVCLHLYLRTWFAPEQALAGVALVAATLSLTFTNSWPHPDSIPELALFALGAMAIARHRDLLFAIVLALAAFNRETSAFLVLLYFVVRPLTTAHLVRTAAFGLEWFAIYAGLRIVRGLAHYDYWQAARNWSDLHLLPANYDPYYRVYAYFVLILFGPILYVALRGLRKANAPLFVSRALLVVPAFVLVGFLFSNIIESRIFTPLYVFVLPALMFALFTADRAH